MNKKKLKLKWILGIHKVLPNFPDREDLLFDLVDYLYQRDSLKEFFNKNIFKMVYGSKKYEELRDKIDVCFETLINDNKLKAVPNSSNFILNKELIDYLN